MSNAPAQPNRRSFLAECASILYWAFFKPSTFHRWLRAIDPDLDVVTNPFSLRERFGANPRLRRYANQVWLISALAPALAMPLAGIIHPLLSGGLSAGLLACCF
ncbi:MAG: hypothetical protein RMJ48_12360 [Roseiflexaceae bacterium]|nr:hypothetical protein [Roseiflexaceae bacterium]